MQDQCVEVCQWGGIEILEGGGNRCVDLGLKWVFEGIWEGLGILTGRGSEFGLNLEGQ